MEIKVKYLKSFLIVTTVVLLIVLVLSHVKKTFEKVDDYILEKVEVYIPSKKLVSYYQPLSIDIELYWVFSLNDKEKIKMADDIKNNKWAEMEQSHVTKLQALNYFGDENEYPRIIPTSAVNHTCYIYIYDFSKDRNITNNENSITSDCDNWGIFLYDVDEGYYYLIRQSM